MTQYFYCTIEYRFAHQRQSLSVMERTVEDCHNYDKTMKGKIQKKKNVEKGFQEGFEPTIYTKPYHK